MDSDEIGHGGVLIKNPNMVTRDEESEASSLPIDSKTYIANDTYSGSTPLPVNTANKGMSFPDIGSEEVKKPKGYVAQESTERDKISYDKLHVLQNSNSPLKSIDLKDVVNFEEFMRNLTYEEQQQLMKYLPSTDTAKLPDSLRSMFDSPQFAETLSSYKHLLFEGILDLSFSSIESVGCRTLKRLALVDMAKSKWVEQYELLKDVKCKMMGGNGSATGINSPGCSNSVSVKRTRDGHSQKFPEPKGLVKSPKRMPKYGTVKVPLAQSMQNSSDAGIKVSPETEGMDNGESCLSPSRLFALPPDRSCTMLDSLQFTDDSSDQDLLFDVPSYTSFPQAELLDCRLWRQTHPSKKSPTQ